MYVFVHFILFIFRVEEAVTALETPSAPDSVISEDDQCSRGAAKGPGYMAETKSFQNKKVKNEEPSEQNQRRSKRQQENAEKNDRSKPVYVDLMDESL